MVPLVGSSLRNPRYIARDKHANTAHNVWYDSSIVDDHPGVPLFPGSDFDEILAASESCWDFLQGPIPPSVFGRASKKDDDDVTAAPGEPVKAKRKCGRPRNPIPRHKRESHITAEHRRRSKIQNGFRTLKGMVPKYEHSSGRDSKADILFKAVDHCKQLKRENDEMKGVMESLRAERESLNNEIRNYQHSVPSLNEMTKSMNDRFDDYAEEKTNNGWAAWTFKLIIRPLFDSYLTSVSSSSLSEFLTSVAQWSDNALDASSIRHTVVASLQEVAIETDLGSSVDMEEERFPMVPDISHMPLQMTDKRSHNLAFHTGTSCQSPTSPLIDSYSPQPMTSLSPQNHSASSLSPHSPIMQAYRNRNHCYDAIQLPGQVGNTCIPLSGHQIGTPSEAVSFEDDSRVLPNLSPRLGYQTNADLLAFPDGETSSHLCQNINSSSLFSDLPLGMDTNISLGGYLRTSNDSFEEWHQQDHQQQYQNYSGLLEGSQSHAENFENDENMPESNTFFDMNKTQSNWSSHQFLDHSQPLPLSEYNTFSERDGKYDSPVSQESFPTLTQLDSSPAYTHRIRRTAEDQRHKSPSMSSAEGDVGVLCATSFSKHAMEVSQDQDIYCPLTPSTDGCNSPIDVSHFDSPFAKNDRVSNDLSFHDGSRDLHSLNKSVFLDPISKNYLTNDHIPSSLPSYKDTFGLRDNHQKLKGAAARRVSDSSPNQIDAAPFNKLKNMESSSLLAELLGPTKFFKANTTLTTNSQKNVGRNMRPSSSSRSSPSQQWSYSDCLSEVNGRTLHRQPMYDSQSKLRVPMAGSFLDSSRNNQINIANTGSDNSNSRSDNVRASINKNAVTSLDKINNFKVSEHLSFEVAHQMLLQSYGIVSDSCGKSHGDFDDVLARSRTSFLDQSPSVSEVDTMITLSQISRPSDFISTVVGPLTLGSTRVSSERSTASRKISFDDSHPYDRTNDDKKHCQWPNFDQSFEGVRLDSLQPRYCSTESANHRNEGLEMKPVVNQV